MDAAVASRRPVEPAEPVRQQLLAADAHVGRSRGRVRVALEVAGRERVDVDERLQLMVVGRAVGVAVAVRGGAGVHQAAPERGRGAMPARFGTFAIRSP